MEVAKCLHRNGDIQGQEDAKEGLTGNPTFRNMSFAQIVATPSCPIEFVRIVAITKATL